MKSQKALICSITFLFIIGITTMAFANRFIDNGDGTVTDTSTGLKWQKEGDGIDRTLSDAKSYCENLVLADIHNWRLPRIDELETIVDYTRYDPAMDPSFTFLPGVYGHWSKTQTLYDSGGYFWGLGFDYGYVSYTVPSNGLRVICVSGGPFWSPDPSDRLQAYTEEIVKDTRSWRMWQRSDAGSPRTWENGNTYCNELQLGGYTDWRLPSVEELESIIDYAVADPAISPLFYGRSANYWTATPFAEDPSSAWTVLFYLGGVAWGDRTSNAYVRCVRNFGACTAITGNKCVDEICCVVDNTYQDTQGLTTHETYVSCVSNAAVECGLSNRQTQKVVRAASRSEVNK